MLSIKLYHEFNNNFVLITASSKTLSFFNKDTRGEVQTVTFDTEEVKTLFYGSFHKVRMSDCLNLISGLETKKKFLLLFIKIFNW